MNERAKVEVPIRWILGDPEEWERIDLREHLAEDGSISTVNIGESGCYEGDLISDLADESMMDVADVVAVVYRYHEWIEVLVLESRATGRDVVACLVMGNDDYRGSSLANIEPEVVRAMTQWAFIESVAM
jgi:hypothetical protein